MHRWIYAFGAALVLGGLAPSIVTGLTLAGAQDATPLKQVFVEGPAAINATLFRLQHPGTAAWIAASFLEFLVPFVLVACCLPRRTPTATTHRRAFEEAVTQFHAEDFD